jgi:hypothetical protein
MVENKEIREVKIMPEELPGERRGLRKPTSEKPAEKLLEQK